MTLLRIVLIALVAAFAVPATAQDKGTTNMEILRQKVKADKKLVVASNMNLTEAEAKAFWPIYEEYQTELRKVNDQLAAVIVNYAKDFNANTLTDDKALRLVDQMMMAEQADTTLKQTFVPKLSKVLPGKKVARYVQIENKIRAIVKYELAGGVPLAQ